jgi:hypothetical protein
MIYEFSVIFLELQTFNFLIKLMKHFCYFIFLLKVTGEGRKRNQVTFPRDLEVSFPERITDADLRSLQSSVEVCQQPLFFSLNFQLAFFQITGSIRL